MLIFLPRKSYNKGYHYFWLNFYSLFYLLTFRFKKAACFQRAKRKKVYFDLQLPHKEKILIRRVGKGGEISVECLRRLKFTPRVSEEILNRLKKVEKSYSAVHVRNTDLQTDYAAFFSDIAHKVEGENLLICSDDYACINYAKEFFKTSNVFTVSDIPDIGGIRLHANLDLDRYKTNLDTLADLIALALCDELFICNHKMNRLSGYSMLARNLNSQKEIVWELLGRNCT